MDNEIRLAFFEQSHLDSITGYTLPPEQMHFTALPDTVFERLSQRKDTHAKPVTILGNGHPLGFLVLDYGEDKFDLTDNAQAILVRSLSLNPLYQGKGYGKRAMQLIDDFVQMHYRSVNELVLAVNEENTAAFQLYLRVGYKYEGKKCAGLRGMQYVMSKNL